MREKLIRSKSHVVSNSYHFVYIMPVCVCLSLQSILSASISSHSININIPSYTVLSYTIINCCDYAADVHKGVTKPEGFVLWSPAAGQWHSSW